MLWSRCRSSEDMLARLACVTLLPTANRMSALSMARRRQDGWRHSPVRFRLALARMLDVEGGVGRVQHRCEARVCRRVLFRALLRLAIITRRCQSEQTRAADVSARVGLTSGIRLGMLCRQAKNNTRSRITWSRTTSSAFFKADSHAQRLSLITNACSRFAISQATSQ